MKFLGKDKLFLFYQIHTKLPQEQQQSSKLKILIQNINSQKTTKQRLDYQQIEYFKKEKDFLNELMRNNMAHLDLVPKQKVIKISSFKDQITDQMSKQVRDFRYLKLRLKRTISRESDVYYEQNENYIQQMIIQAFPQYKVQIQFLQQFLKITIKSTKKQKQKFEKKINQLLKIKKAQWELDYQEEYIFFELQNIFYKRNFISVLQNQYNINFKKVKIDKNRCKIKLKGIGQKFDQGKSEVQNFLNEVKTNSQDFTEKLDFTKKQRDAIKKHLQIKMDGFNQQNKIYFSKGKQCIIGSPDQLSNFINKCNKIIESQITSKQVSLNEELKNFISIRQNYIFVKNYAKKIGGKIFHDKQRDMLVLSGQKCQYIKNWIQGLKINEKAFNLNKQLSENRKKQILQLCDKNTSLKIKFANQSEQLYFKEKQGVYLRCHPKMQFECLQKYKSFLESNDSTQTFIVQSSSHSYQVNFVLKDKNSKKFIIGSQKNTQYQTKRQLQLRRLEKGIVVEGFFNEIQYFEKQVLIQKSQIKFYPYMTNQEIDPLLNLLKLKHPSITISKKKENNKEQDKEQDKQSLIQAIKITGDEHEQAKKLYQVEKQYLSSYPDYWDKQILFGIKQDSDCQIVELKQDSDKFQQVKNQFLQGGVTKAEVLKIQVAISRARHKQFMRRKQLLESNRGDANLKFLFHGSAYNQAAKFAKDSNGLDPQYASPGLWGKGVYLAVGSYYSDQYGYVHKKQDGTRQIYYCKALLGKCKMSANMDRGMVNAPEGYDSVNGNTKNTEVYIVYKNDRAFIDCIITYKKV